MNCTKVSSRNSFYFLLKNQEVFLYNRWYSIWSRLWMWLWQGALWVSVRSITVITVIWGNWIYICRDEIPNDNWVVMTLLKIFSYILFISKMFNLLQSWIRQISIWTQYVNMSQSNILICIWYHKISPIRRFWIVCH